MAEPHAIPARLNGARSSTATHTGVIGHLSAGSALPPSTIQGRLPSAKWVRQRRTNVLAITDRFRFYPKS
jgi:hypothetical protein